MSHPSLRLILAGAVLSIQILLAAGMLLAPRPAPYGWQMYSAVPYNPPAWAITGGHREPINVEALLVQGRAEIDRVAVLRSIGCDRTGADAVVIELEDGTLEEVSCP